MAGPPLTGSGSQSAPASGPVIAHADAGCTRTGTALKAALPESLSIRAGSVMSLTLAPALLAASLQPTWSR